MTLRFGDGTEETADLLVGADGIASAVRARLARIRARALPGYTTWRTLVPADAALGAAA